MRTSTAALVLARRERNGSTEWLAQWNDKWRAFALVGGHKRPDESFRECAIRETTEELNLRSGVDFEIGEIPAAHLEYTAYSESAGVETAYTIELFDVRFLTEAALNAVTNDKRNCWLREEAIRSGTCATGRPVSSTVKLIFDQMELWTTQGNV